MRGTPMADTGLRVEESELDRELRKRFRGLSEPERVREYFYDPNTGLPNERGFEALCRRGKEELYAQYSIEGLKWVNDSFTHEEGQLLCRMAARALFAQDANIAKVRGDFAGQVRSQEEARAIAKSANRALPDDFKGFCITVHVGSRFESLSREHGELKEREELAGNRAPRGSRPLAVPWGWSPDAVPFPKARVKQPLNETLVAAHRALGYERALSAYRDPMTGLLSSHGMQATERPGCAVLALDLDGLKASDQFNSRLGDEVIARVGTIMRVLGGDEVRAAHPHGDEFRASHPDPSRLREYAKEVSGLLKDTSVTYCDPALGLTFVQQGLGLSYGVGATSLDAERQLEEQKLERTERGERDGHGQKEVAEQRLRFRPATREETERARAAQGRDRWPGDLGARHASRRGRTAGEGRQGEETRAEEGPALATRSMKPAQRGSFVEILAEEPTQTVSASPDLRSGDLQAVGLRPETLRAPPFLGRFHEREGQAAFPTPEGKGIWKAQGGRVVRRVVLLERPVDAMSHYQLRGQDNAALYLATGNELGPQLRDELAQILAGEARAGVGQVVFAFGSSRRTAALASELAKVTPPGMSIVREAPVRGTWSDALRVKERDSIRRQGLEVSGKRTRSRGPEITRERI